VDKFGDPVYPQFANSKRAYLSDPFEGSILLKLKGKDSIQQFQQDLLLLIVLSLQTKTETVFSTASTFKETP